MTPRAAKMQRAKLALAAVATALYLPFSWILLIDRSWDSYRLTWLKMLPVMPGFVPGAYFFHPHDALEFTAMGLTTVALLVGLTWLGTLGRYGLVAAIGIASLISVPSALAAYACFRA